ncbi:MAG: ferredoxin [Acidimicrobiia bacterium]
MAANGEQLQGRIAVWVDPDLCTGDANCATNVPAIFTMNDGLAYIVGDDDHEGLTEHTRLVPEGLEEDVVAEAEECPGECIFVEVIGNAISADQVQLGL